ncbi:MAG: diaminopimelate epimerase [Pseudomonadota bacterium]
MNGLGNDFVILDLRHTDHRPSEAEARAIANRAAGVGCDQVITIEPSASKATSAYMGVINADGSVVGACGNAARCVASLLLAETSVDAIALDTMSGRIRAQRAGDDVAVDMGSPKFDWEDIPLSERVEDTRFLDIKLGPIDAPVLWGPSGVSMGNPHCVFFADDAEAHAIDRFGPMIEHHPLFPERANVSVAEVKARDRIRLRVWERGVGVTKACGTAACAALAAAHRRRLTDREATVDLDGGPLSIAWRDDNHIVMTGPVAHEFDGVLDAAYFQDVDA